MWDPYAMFEERTLGNGLKVYASQWPDRPWQGLGVIVHTGAMSDPVGREGLAHFVEHMAFENTSTVKDQINDFFEDCGGNKISGTTSYHDTRYGFFLPADPKLLAQGLEFLGQMLCTARLENFIEREREVVLGEFRSKFPTDTKVEWARRERQALYLGLWPARFLRPLGAPESIKAINQTDLQAHYDTYYAAPNMSVIGLGGLSVDDFVAIVRDSSFGRLAKMGTRQQLGQGAAEVLPLADRGHTIEISKHLKTDQVFDRGGYTTTVRLPATIDTPALRLVSDMLDQMLDAEVRQKRAGAYHVGSNWYWMPGLGYEFSIDCQALTLSVLGEIENIVTDLIGSLADRSELFERVKRRALARHRLRERTGHHVADDVGRDLARFGRIISLREECQELDQTTLADIAIAAKWLAPEYRFTVITKP